MATISGIAGAQIAEGSEDYDESRYQYATSSYPEERMKPALIIYPTNKEEIAQTLKYAKSQGIAVAIRTGGHQYSTRDLSLFLLLA